MTKIKIKYTYILKQFKANLSKMLLNTIKKWKKISVNILLNISFMCSAPLWSSLCISVEYTPEQSVGWWSSVGNVVEKNFQFIVIIKVRCDDSANRRWHGKLLCGDVLVQKISAYQNLKLHSIDTLHTWENQPKNGLLTAVVYTY